MNKAELVAILAEKCDLSKAKADTALVTLLDTIEKELAGGGKLTLTGFGTFEVRERKARVGRNPQTGAEIKIAACKVPAFKPGKVLKSAVK